jgi:hypothetical protein
MKIFKILFVEESMRKVLRFLIPASFILAVLVPGCYTVLMHSSDEGDYRVSQTSNCLSCHSDYQEYPYGYYYSPAPSFWWQYPNYGYYYATPWWWGYYEYDYLDGDYRYHEPDMADTKFGPRERDNIPIRPPHVFQDPGYLPPNSPGIWDIPGTYNSDPTRGTGTSRSRTEEETGSGEENQQTQDANRPSRPTYNDGKTDNSQQGTEPAPKPKEDSSKKKKKDRRGRGGS